MQIKKYSEISDKEYKIYTGIVLYESGDKAYYLNGNLHRTDGPALESVNGYKAWYFHGKVHRTDGPAIEHASGDKYWYYQGQPVNVKSQEEFESYLKVMAFE